MSAKRVTLTFDNGPDPEITPYVLDILEREEIKSTFFVVGEKLRDRERRKLCERAHSAGHWIGNHTFNHLTPLGLSREENVARFEITRTQELLSGLEHPCKLFRPFGGGGALDKSLLNEAALACLTEGHYTCVLWNVVPRDWEIPKGWVDVAMEECRQCEWPLVVLHDLQTGAMEQLEEFIQRMKGDGYEFMQEFPDDCMPIVQGNVVGRIDRYVTGSSSKTE